MKPSQAGAVPFTVQGPENALCLDGGRTIGWEIAEQLAAPEGPGGLDAMFVQVGGGAFAACLGAGLVEMGQRPPLIAVQAEGCAPLDRAWRLGATAADDWSTVMTPWADPASLADGILDDETYDWIGVARSDFAQRAATPWSRRSRTSSVRTRSPIGPDSTPAPPGPPVSPGCSKRSRAAHRRSGPRSASAWSSAASPADRP